MAARTEVSRGEPKHGGRVLAGLVAVAAVVAFGARCEVQRSSYVNWESIPVHGLEITPDGARLLVVNTPDARIEVFDLTTPLPELVASVPVGLDPVSVRARNANEAWVANLLSDSVSIVDLATANVVATLTPGDEPQDLIFAGGKVFVSVSQENAIRVYDPTALGTAPLTVPIAGEDPRALATDGTRVYAAVFESGNETTVLAPDRVSDPTGPYGGTNPPPNAGASFSPPLASGLPPAPANGLIVARAGGGAWLDVNGADFGAFVSWDLHDHDVAVLPVANPSAVSYLSGLMNLDMALAVRPDGHVTVVGTEAENLVRFEPNLKGTFLRVRMASFDPAGGAPTLVDLNPHLDYQTSSIPPAERERTVSDPRAIAWSSGGTGYVAGLHTDNVVAITAGGARVGRVDTGAGPASLAIDEARGRLYVLNRFDASISVIDTTTLGELARIRFHDPTPRWIRDNRPMLYDAHESSGLGLVSCASCHVDGKMDQIAWDLGDPSGAVQDFDQTCLEEGFCADFHPMKGPMVTQTLVGIVGVEPLHWRGDRNDLAAFSGAFVSLLGDDAEPSETEMQGFEDLVRTFRFPPNPYRKLDGTVQNALLWNGGNPAVGEQIYFNDLTDGPRRCNDCHAFPTGTSGRVVPGNPDFFTNDVKVAHLRNLYEKTGFSKTSLASNRGFGFTHDGTEATIFDGFGRGGFSFPDGAVGDQQRRDVEAFVLSFSTDVPASVGRQLTVGAGGAGDPAVRAFIETLVDLASGQTVGLIVKGRVEGAARGAFLNDAGLFETDLSGEVLDLDALLDLAGAGGELTFTVVPFESRERMGVDRDEDGKLDRDEVLAGTDPADASS